MTEMAWKQSDHHIDAGAFMKSGLAAIEGPF